MKSTKIVVLVAVMALLAAACSDDEGGTTGTTGATGTTGGTSATGATGGGEKVEVALLLPCAINDLTWCQQAYDGAKALEAEGLITLAYVDNAQQDAATAEQQLASYAQEGSQLVIGHSFNYGDPVNKIAPDYPEVDFAWQGGMDGVGPNFADYDLPLYEPAYLAGILAGGVSKTGVLGGLAGFDIPVCHSMISAFTAGADDQPRHPAAGHLHR